MGLPICVTESVIQESTGSDLPLGSATTDDIFREAELKGLEFASVESLFNIGPTREGCIFRSHQRGDIMARAAWT